MANTANNPLPVEDEDRLQQETLSQVFMDWVRTELVWYAGSFSFHLLALSVLLLLPNFGGDQNRGDAVTFESKVEEEVKDKGDIDTDTVVGEMETTPPFDDRTWQPLPPVVATAETDGDDKQAGTGCVGPTGNPDKGSGGTGAWEFGPGPKLTGPIGGPCTGHEGHPGGWGFIPPDRGKRPNEPPSTKRAVNLALVWLANHQLSDGSWSLQNYTQRCHDRTCTGPGNVSADAGATAMGLLPFLAIGQTHRSQGHYKETVRLGVQWLVSHQQSDGNLAKGAQQMMYSHALATIALCEAYGMSGDRQVGMAAQGGVNFILAAQNTTDGGWRYNPNDPGDTSVVGWQLMALKSAHMAGLNVGGSAFANTSKWLDSVAVHDGAEYAYQPGNPSSNTMTSVGLLCRQYLGAKRDNPMLAGGVSYLMNHLPDEGFPNIYYWYYATQVMHNMSGSDWDVWNRKIRNLLVHTQVRNADQCANGSWAPENDPWGKSGGRLMTTSLATLTLEVYYRYLPLFKTEESRP